LEDAFALLMTVEPDLDAYQPLFAAKADILRRQGRDAALPAGA
jgi:predicted RNA polymerase sigma factor